jgi:hypothetical protein
VRTSPTWFSTWPFSQPDAGVPATGWTAFGGTTHRANTMAAKSKATRSTHEAFVVTGEGESAFWIKIGAAWAHEDSEGYNISLGGSAAEWAHSGPHRRSDIFEFPLLALC